MRNLTISRLNHVWAADITYIPMSRGFVYLFAVLDWVSRRVVGVAALQYADDRFLSRCGAGRQRPLWSTGDRQSHQGCQCTSQEFTGLLTHHGIQSSMDGKGCWRDNVFVERLWKSITYEEAYLHADDTVRAAHQYKLPAIVDSHKENILAE